MKNKLLVSAFVALLALVGCVESEDLNGAEKERAEMEAKGYWPKQ